MKGDIAVECINRLLDEHVRHCRELSAILDHALAQSTLDPQAADDATQRAYDAGSAHGHPGAPSRRTTPVPSPYNAATGGVSAGQRRVMGDQHDA